MVRVGIVGALGRMGQGLAREVICNDKTTLAFALDIPESEMLGKDIGEILGVGKTGVEVTCDLETCIDVCDVIIDFTNPLCSLNIIEQVKKHNKKLVLGTTGFSDEDKLKIKELGKTNAVVFAPNMSIGVNLIFKIAGQIAQLLGEDYDIEIVEAHHKFKKDAPSGTALAMAEVIADALKRDLKKDAVYGREGMVGERKPKEIGIHAVRAGDIIGEHTITYATQGERVELTHKAHSRNTFVGGAVRAAIFLGDKDKGLYDMQDVIS